MGQGLPGRYRAGAGQAGGLAGLCYLAGAGSDASRLALLTPLGLRAGRSRFLAEPAYEGRPVAAEMAPQRFPVTDQALGLAAA